MKYLIVVLGNIGSEYEDTRHNIGFNIVDALAKASTIFFEPNKLGDTATLKFKGRTFILLKPSTYMNLSGKSVKYWLKSENISIENLLIIGDDLNLPFGKLRLKSKGSNGGHNGLRDIENQLETINYNRLRFGISNEFKKGQQSNFVLNKFKAEELLALESIKKITCELIVSFVMNGLSYTMNTYNSKS